jgi:L-ascorbate metabolism protein UlaG (beta-lactamase superfamily)
MADQLLVRSYHVAVGDCIHVIIPDGGKDFHILIDCGSLGDQSLLAAAMTHLVNELPAIPNTDKKRLDLLVATHVHEDHIKGFVAEYFKDVQIGSIWLSAVMNPQHPQAKQTLRLHALATQQMRALAVQGLALSPELEGLIALFSISNDGALDVLRNQLPQRNGIQPKFVSAGMSSADPTLALGLQDTTIHVLAPESNIDFFYLGDETAANFQGFTALSASIKAKAAPAADSAPRNISASDFRRLQTRMLSNQLAFADLAGSLQNNMSVVLLIEWRGRRLLFVGDAEWEGKFRQGKKNGSWNVMWNQRNAHLKQPIDFLKIGHHGSENATPWDSTPTPTNEVNQILDAILPIPPAGSSAEAQAIVSTVRKNYKSIPDSDLLVEIGKRVKNTRRYKRVLEAKGLDLATELPFFSEREERLIDEPQPIRTDFEAKLANEPYVEVKIDPAD